MVKASVKQKSARSFWTVDSETLPFKIHFFLYYGAVGGFTPLLTVFTRSKLSLTDGQVASLFASYQFFTIIAKPIIGLIVDYFNKLKLVIIIFSILLAITASSVLFLPGIDNGHHADHHLNLSSQSSFTLQCDFDVEPVACHIVQTFCSDAKYLNLLNRSVSQFNFDEHSVDDSRRIKNGAFKFCNVDEGLVPHSAASNSFECTKVMGQADLNYTACVYFSRTAENGNQSSKTFVLSEAKADSVKYNAEDDFNEAIILCSSVNSSLLIVEEADFIIYLPQYSYFKCYANYFNYSNYNIFLDLVQTSEKLPKSAREKQKISPYSTYQFWTLAFFLLCSGTCANALFMLSDTACYEVLQKTGADYGKQRVWGAIGWGIMSAAAGYLNDLASEYSSLPDYSAGFFLCSGFCVLIIINISRVDLVKPDLSESAGKEIRALLKNPEFVIFATGTLLTGFLISSVWFYLPVFVESIGGDKLLQGLLQTSQSLLGAIPFMFFSGWILKKIGCMSAMILTFIIFAVRFTGYYLLQDPWWVLMIEPTHGICFGLFCAALTSIAKASAPVGAEATTQSILSCLFEDVGAGLGCIAVGISFDIFGSRETFLVLAICSCAAAVLQCLAVFYLNSRRKGIQISTKG